MAKTMKGKIGSNGVTVLITGLLYEWHPGDVEVGVWIGDRFEGGLGLLRADRSPLGPRDVMRLISADLEERGL